MPGSRSPQHIGFIADGNRRWAKERGLETRDGHLAGYRVFKELAFATIGRGIPFVSFHLFSTETWKRTEDEVGWLLMLVRHFAANDASEFTSRGIRIRFAGRRTRFVPELNACIDRCERLEPEQLRGTVVIALDYGGRTELVDAVRCCLHDGVRPEALSGDDISARQYLPEVPDLDLVIRTAERRLSNFMLWRLAFSEVLFLDKLWPDMTGKDVDDALEDWRTRIRSLGGDRQDQALTTACSANRIEASAVST